MKNQGLGATIAMLRKEKGLTQLELANLLGVTDKAVSKWERDLSWPDVGTLPRLAEILGISVDELMQVRTQSPQETGVDRFKATLNTVFKALACAMGVAVTTLSSLGQLELQGGFTLLGIGLACAGLALLQDKKE